jgi:hypothetical protein
MRKERTGVFLGLILVVAVFLSGPTGQFRLSLQNDVGLLAGRNVNMISGRDLPDGDPFLQRQNEPSVAVSTRNPLHLLAGANDYRTVDIPIPFEDLPGPPEGAAVPTRDAWVGFYRSDDGGQSWKSSLHPGFPQDITTAGVSSPLKAFSTAADPVIRAGTNGMFYYAGIAFTRNQSNNSVFISRFIDNNNEEGPEADNIKFIDTKVLETGNIAQFIDKPWLAVDIPRNGAKRVTIPSDPPQSIYAGNVYVAYSVFTGQDPSNPYSKIMVVRSLDCGATWEKAAFISESSHVNQGAAIAIAPKTGYVYVAWRRFAHDTAGPAIMIARSVDGGKNFTKPQLVANIVPFDQGTSAYSFRTNSYPAITVDYDGVIYIAWAQRGVGPLHEDGQGATRIMISTSTDGLTWYGPWEVAHHTGNGHQFQPTLSYGMGKVTCVWFDQRYDASGHFDTYISDEPGRHSNRHTIDVRAAQSTGAMPPAAPGFGASVPVTRYLHLTDAYQDLQQVQFNPPNYPMFKEGTRPFHGDYIDVALSPPFLPNGESGWKYNTDDTSTPVFHAAWTDNRNVKQPKNGNWAHYTPPESTQPGDYATTMKPCLPGQTSMRNQDVYMASLSGGIIVGSPSNFKSLSANALKEAMRAFVVFVKNMTKTKRTFKLIIFPPANGSASFKQFEPRSELVVDVAPASSISRTVFAKSTAAHESFRVEVEEVGGNGLRGTVVLNPDIENPDIENPDIENHQLHNPDIENPDIENPDIENVIILNPDIENPDIENTDFINPDIENEGFENPDIENPDIENAAWLNPDIENPDIENPDIENGSISDYTWKVTNKGTTASAYTFRMISAGFQGSEYPGFGFQLLIYKVHRTPAATSDTGSCDLVEKHQDELIANIKNPDIENPDIENPDIENPDIENGTVENATFWLAPGETAYLTLRVYDPNKNDEFEFDFDAVDGVATAQSVNAEDELAGKKVPPIAGPFTSLTIYNSSLPSVTREASYTAYLVAIGGTAPYLWSIPVGALPPGLLLDSTTGKISGTPNQADTFPFTAQVTDAANNTATRNLQIIVSLPCTVNPPNTPVGTATGGINVPYIFTTGGSTDSEGHPVEYCLQWAKGADPALYTGWTSSTTITITFNAVGTYQVRAQARCQTIPSVTSSWSAAKTVMIYENVSTIQGTVTYNGLQVTLGDALGVPASFYLSDANNNNQAFPSSPTYNSSSGAYSIPNIPQGLYNLYVRIDAPPANSHYHFPGDYDGYISGINVPAGPAVVPQPAAVQKLLHLTSPADNGVLHPWPGPTFEIFASPVLMGWDPLAEAASYRCRLDKYQSSPHQIISNVAAITTAGSQYTFTLPASGANDHYQFSLDAYSGLDGTGIIVGRLMIEYVSGYGWDYRFRIVPGDQVPPAVTSFTPAAGASGVAFDASLKITFDENVQKGTGNIVVKKSSNDAVFQTINVASGLVTIASNVVTINHDVLGAATGYYVQVEATCFDDLAGNSYAGVSDKTTWSFTTADVAGLLASYLFNGNAADSSGNGNNGTIQGTPPVFVPDRFGQANGALEFNGVDNYVSLPNESSFDLTAFTITAIVRVPDFSRRNYIISKGPNFGNYTIMVHGPTDADTGSVSYAHRTAGGNWSAGVSNGVILVNQFVHLAVALVDSNSYTAFMNGQQTWTSIPSPLVLNDDSATVGRYSSATPAYFLGVVDEIRIYNRVLSANEIKALYNKDR